MKTFTRLFLFLVAFLPVMVMANAYVHGTVKYANGQPVANFPVHIEGDSGVAAAACHQTHIRYTNAYGAYADTLTCSTAMTTVRTWVVNCNGAAIIQNRSFTATQTAESNFVICDSSVNTSCHALFSFQAANTTVSFYSGGSTAGNGLADTINSRTWTFGDGTGMSGNTTNPVHTYTAAGAYTVCLKITTTSGCQSTTCAAVVVTAATNTGCNAVFFSQPITGLRYRFNSTASMAIPGDSITSRRWTFGDGDSLAGNTINPEHTYLQPGTYTVCLRIKTVQGCEKTFCLPVIVINLSTSCHASFIYQLLSTTAAGFPVRFNSNSSTVGAGDSLVQRLWKFGDGTTGTGIEPVHMYAQSGTYTACLTIVALSGCRDSICQTIIIPSLPQPHCEAVFSTDTVAAPANGNPALRYRRFNSTNSHGSPVSDSIISRRWTFGDGTTLTGNIVIPVHGYAQPGTYNVCLRIETASRCLDSICKTVVIVAPAVSCQSRFTTTASGLMVTYNGSPTTIAPGDSIITRTWSFGDGGSFTSNGPIFTHQYAAPGIYNVCLTIRTRLGCTATWCKPVAVVNVAGNCVPFFTKEQVAAPARTLRFNSSAAYSQIPNDSIISRKWEFGDGQVLTGNVVAPLHTYAQGGTYTACLTIYTAHCDKRWCQTVQVLPLNSTTPNDSIAIVNLYPTPVTSQLNAMIYSAYNNLAAELAIYDIYGVRKWYQNVTLPLGNSTYNIPTSQLAAGPYIFRLTTVHGVKSRTFYKL